MPTGARVIVENGPLAGEVFEVKEKLTVGRRPENLLRLKEEQISRFHAIIERRGTHYVIEDLSSRSGVVVDDRLVRGSAVLPERARILIGQTILQFEVDDPGIKTEDLVTAPRAIAYHQTINDRLPMPPPRSVETPVALNLTVVPMTAAASTQDLEAKDLAQLRRAGEHLQALLTANAVISTELNLEKLFDKVLAAVFEAFPAHRAVVMTADGEHLLPRATRVDKAKRRGAEPQVSSTIAYRAFRDRVGVLTLDAGRDERFDQGQSIIDQDIRSAICAPMIHQEEVLGVLYCDTLGIRQAFKEDDLRLLAGMASAAAGAVKNALLVGKLQETAIDTIFRLAVAAEYRDDDTGFHIYRMSEYAAAMARALGQAQEWTDRLRLASPMHDVGKIGIPDSILKKPGKLTPEEYEVMKQHPNIGAAILANSGSELLQMAERIARSHHEKWNGQGYPRGIKGADIPLEGRIVAIADVFDAVTSKRCYKPAFALEKSIGILKDGAGQHFDPELVEAFLSIESEILAIREHYASLEQEAHDPSGATVAHLITRRPPSPASAK
ncbi:MAG: HD domain-containing protein [Deltaproteobacteria bacterium]|nr:HD domain-containing protein [Deltaproteobacteria bacterium]